MRRADRWFIEMPYHTRRRRRELLDVLETVWRPASTAVAFVVLAVVAACLL